MLVASHRTPFYTDVRIPASAEVDSRPGRCVNAVRALQAPRDSEEAAWKQPCATFSARDDAAAFNVKKRTCVSTTASPVCHPTFPRRQSCPLREPGVLNNLRRRRTFGGVEDEDPLEQVYQGVGVSVVCTRPSEPFQALRPPRIRRRDWAWRTIPPRLPCQRQGRGHACHGFWQATQAHAAK